MRQAGQNLQVLQVPQMAPAQLIGRDRPPRRAGRRMLALAFAASAASALGCGDSGDATSTSAKPSDRITYSVVSEGRSSPETIGQVKFLKGGLAFYSKTGALGGGRGFNVAIVDRMTGEPSGEPRNFDTFDSRDSGTALAALVKHLEAVPDGRLVLLGIAEEGGLTDYDSCQKIAAPWLLQGIEALEKLGIRKLREYCFRGSWAAALVKGEGKVLDEKVDPKQSVTVEATVTVGR